MRTFFTTTYFIKVAMLSILLSLSYLSNAQTVVIPENVRRKCADVPLQDKVRLAVARFSQTTDVGSGRNIDNFATMHF